MKTTCSIYGMFTELVQIKRERERKENGFIRKHKH